MTKKQKKELGRILITVVLVAAAVTVFHFVPLPGSLWVIELAVYLAIYLLIGGGVLLKAVKNIFSGRFLDENFLMSIATVGAFFLSEYVEAVAVMLFYCVGELFQSCAVGKSRKSIASLMDMRADFARVIRENGETEETDPFEVQPGDRILVKPGEKIPLDGVVEDGRANINTASITGESAPVPVSPGENVVSGTVNTDGLLQIRVTKKYEESTVSKILELVENSAANKSKTEKFITRFAAVYTPAVVGGAVLLAVLPSLVTGNWMEWLRRALIFLVVSCPCALVISVPMSFFGGIGGASKQGILVKGADYLEKLAKADTFVFDKTGTVTSGCFEVAAVCPAAGVPEETLLAYTLAAEQFSNHPIAECVCGYCRRNGTPELQANCKIEELAGLGVCCTVGGHTVYAGNRRLAESRAMPGEGAEELPSSDQTAVYVVADGRYAGLLVLADRMKPGAAEAIAALKELGAKQTVMLSGDKTAAAEAIAEKAGIDRCVGELLPDGKVKALEGIMAEAKGMTVYTGDGINDAPVLALSDVGIAMGGIGQDAAIEAADIVIMDDDVARLPLAVRIARKTMRIVRQNIVFAITVKLAVLALAAFGLSSMWIAVFADVGVAVLAILNAMRAIRSPR